MSAAEVVEAVEVEQPSVPRSRCGEPAWEAALLLPRQGDWTEEEYLAIETNRIVELVDGCLEVHPVPTFLHQFLLRFLLNRLTDFIENKGLLG